MAKWIIDQGCPVPKEIDRASAEALLEQLRQLLQLPGDTVSALHRGNFLFSSGRPIGSADAAPERMAADLVSAARTEAVFFRSEKPGDGVRGLQILDNRLQVTERSFTLKEMGRRIPFSRPEAPFAGSRLWHWLSSTFHGRGIDSVYRYNARKLSYEVQRDTYLRILNYAPAMRDSVKNWKENHLASLFVNKVSDYLFMNPGLQPKVLQFRASHDLGDLLTTPEATRFFEVFCPIQTSVGASFSPLDMSSHCVAARNSDDLIQKKLQEIQSIPGHSSDIAAVSRAAGDLLQIMETRFDPDTLLASPDRADMERLDRTRCERDIIRLFSTDSYVQNYLIAKLFGGTSAERAAVLSMDEAEMLLFCRLHRGDLETVSLPQALKECRKTIAAEKSDAALRPRISFLQFQGYGRGL